MALEESLGYDSGSTNVHTSAYELLETGEAARYIGAHINTIRRWVNRGIIHAYRVGPRGDRRFRMEDLISFIGGDSNYSELLETGEAARYIGAHINTIRRWVNEGKIPVSRVGPRGDRRFRMEDLEKFKEKYFGPTQ